MGYLVNCNRHPLPKKIVEGWAPARRRRVPSVARNRFLDGRQAVLRPVEHGVLARFTNVECVFKRTID